MEAWLRSPEIPLNRYPDLMRYLGGLQPPEKRLAVRHLARTDLYFLLRYLLNRRDVEHPWVFQRIREVQHQPDGHLDLWARAHYKSTVITFAKTIQDILASHGEDPLLEHEQTFGIFSHTRPIAKAFLRQIKAELQYNVLLHELFPDILFEKPQVQAPKWSEDSGIIVRRNSNPKEATVEAWGLVDGQPTSKHFNVLVYDDTVTRESVTTPEMIAKTTEAWELSLNLGARGARRRTIGTRYHFADTYHAMMKRGAAIPRIYPATVDGTLTGEPVMLTRAELEKKIADMGPYTASAQLLQNPIADSLQTIRRDWLRYYPRRSPDTWRRAANIALLVDPANEKKKSSDYTAMAVVGKGQDGNLYLLDAVRDRLGLRERCLEAIRLHRTWKPKVTAWERYGKDADIDALKMLQDEENYRFHVVEVGGTMSKTDRCNRLLPLMSEGRFWLPTDLYRTLSDGQTVDLARVLVEEEFMPWPVPLHDDLFDAIARIFDVTLAWPRGADEKPRDAYADDSPRGSWMSA